MIELSEDREDLQERPKQGPELLQGLSPDLYGRLVDRLASHLPLPTYRLTAGRPKRRPQKAAETHRGLLREAGDAAYLCRSLEERRF